MDDTNRTVGGHWTQDEFLRHLYGLEAEEPALAHLAGCAACGQKWADLQARRGECLLPHTVNETRLRTQRQAIWMQIEEARSARPLGWRAPAAALALMVFMALMVSRPAVQLEDPLVEITEMAAPGPVSDTQFFEEIASVASSTQPAAAEAVESLFEAVGN
jgi:hypothetical protein